MTTAQFETNDHNIATDNDRNEIKRNPRTFYVKLKNDYLKVWFNRDSLHVILSIESRIDEPYIYNLQLKDNKEDSIYLNNGYFDDDNIKKINKLIREYLRTDNETLEIEAKEKQFQENYIEQTKKGLMKKLWG